jgi:hypothetical protein
VSFLTHRTIDQLLHATREPPWEAAYVLRTGSYQPIADALPLHGLVTETDPARTTVQRRFTGPDEQRYAITAVMATGADPTGKEAAGSYHTTMHLSRPPGDLAMPYASLTQPGLDTS